MSIWNNTSPVGFAMQNQIGPGIEIKPIDIRPFLDDSRSGRNAYGGRGSGSTATKKDTDKELKPDGLIGSDNEILSSLQYVNSEIGNSDKWYSAWDKAAEVDKPKVLEAMKQSQAQLAKDKLNLEVALNDSKNQKQLLQADQKIADTKQINRQYVISEDISNSNSGVEFYNNIESIDGTTRKDGKGFNLIKFEDYFSSSDKNSRLIKDESGNISVSPYKHANVNHAGSNEFYQEIRTKLTDTKSIQSITYDGQLITPQKLNEMIATGTYFEQSLSSNQKNLLAVVSNAWDTLTPSAKAHIYSNVLGNRISYTDGVMNTVKDKDGKAILYKEGDEDLVDEYGKAIHKVGDERKELNILYADGRYALNEILKARNDIAKGKIVDGKRQDLSPEEIEKIQARGLMFANGIIGTAKNYAYSVATGQAVGLTQITRNDNLEINKGKGSSNENGDAGTATPLQLMLTKAKITPNQSMYLSNAFGSGANMQSVPDAKTFKIDGSNQGLLSDLMFQTSLEELPNKNISIRRLGSTLILNGVGVTTDSMLASSSDPSLFKVIGIGNTGLIAPNLYVTPEDQDGSLVYNPMKTKDGQMMQENYVPIQIQVPGDAMLQVFEGSNKEVSFVKAEKVFKNKSLYKAMNIEETKDGYSIEVFAPMPDVYANDKGNSASKQALDGSLLNMETEGQALEGFYATRERQQKLREAQLKRVLEPDEKYAFVGDKIYRSKSVSQIRTQLNKDHHLKSYSKEFNSKEVYKNNVEKIIFMHLEKDVEIELLQIEKDEYKNRTQPVQFSRMPTR